MLDEEERAHLQDRLALASLVSMALGWTALVFRLPMLILPSAPSLADLSFTAHFAGGLVPAAVWLACRRGPALSKRALLTLDVVGQLAIAVAYGAMGYGTFVYASGHWMPVPAELIVVLAMTFTTIARAIFVPSSGRRTFGVSVANGASLVVALGLGYVTGTEATPWGSVGPEYSMPALVISSALWWTLIVILATLTSHTIYGLRREVSAARRLGQYALEARLGEGAMGVVWKARHAMLRRPTAVKLLRPERAGARAIARFEQEVQLTARLSHPNTVTVFDYGRTPEGVFYYAMELLDGATLDTLLVVGGPFTPARTAHLLDQVAAALVEAHEAGLVHRDLKPSNIALVRQGGELDVAKVLDFGLVAERGAAIDTADGPITGTPLYMAPELIGGDPSPASDLYALGVVAYELLVGSPPFRGRTVLEVCAQHVEAEVVPPSRRAAQEIPPALEALVLACLEKDPAKRPASARALRAKLAGLDVGRHGQSEAEAWWSEHGDAVGAKRAEGAEGVEALTVDWRRR